MGACGFASDIRVSSSWGNGTGFGSFPHFISKQNPTDAFWLGLGVTSSRKHASIPSPHPELRQLTSRCFGLRPWVPIRACRLSCLGRWSNDINVPCGLQAAQEDMRTSPQLVPSPNPAAAFWVQLLPSSLFPPGHRGDSVLPDLLLVKEKPGIFFLFKF